MCPFQLTVGPSPHRQDRQGVDFLHACQRYRIGASTTSQTLEDDRDTEDIPLTGDLQTASTGQTPTARIVVGAALLAVIALYLYHATCFSGYVNDDAYITFRYSRFLALGCGPYFNVGQHVEGYSNFLFMLILAPIIAAGGEGAAVVGAKTIGVVCGVLGVLTTFALGRFLARSGLIGAARADVCGLLAAGLLAVAPNYALNSVSGLETTLFGFLIVAGVFLGVVGKWRGRWLGSGVVFAAAVLARPEGSLVFAVFLCAQALIIVPHLACLAKASCPPNIEKAARPARLLRPLLVDCIIVACVFLCHLVFRFVFYDGELLPNTYFAKAEGFAGMGAWEYIRQGALTPFLGAIGVIVGVVGWLLAGRGLRMSLPVAAVAVCGCLLPFLTGADWMLGYRLLVPFLPLVAVVVALGWCKLAVTLVRRPSWLGPGLAMCLVGVLWCSQSAYRIELTEYAEVRARGYRSGHAAMARWLRDSAAEPSDTIALMDIGIVGYTCVDQRILDITGLTDRVIARSPGPFLAKRYPPEYVLDKRPEFVVLVFGSAWNPGELTSAEGLTPWTPIEKAIYEHPDFQSSYLHTSPSQAAMADRMDQIAWQLGACRAFYHLYPGRHYVLAVFRRGETLFPATDGGSSPQRLSQE